VESRTLAPVAGRVLIRHVIDWMGGAGIGEVCVCGNSQTAHLRRRLGDGSHVGIVLAYYEDRMPRGPAGCSRDAAFGVGESIFVVADGTIAPRIDLSEVIAAHLRARADATVVVTEGPAPSDSKEPSLAPTGVYVFSAAALELVSPDGYQDIKESLIPALRRSGASIAKFCVPAGEARRVKDAASYLAVNQWALHRLGLGELATEGVSRRMDQAFLLDGAVVHPSARIVGPVLLGAGCAIGADVVLIGPTSIGARCRIERGAVVSRSAVWDECLIGASASVDRCILAGGAVISDGESVRNAVRVAPGWRSGSMYARLRERWGAWRRVLSPNGRSPAPSPSPGSPRDDRPVGGGSTTSATDHGPTLVASHSRSTTETAGWG
jgi:NDP-sugar pyrophosphorylase family protein